MKEGKATGRGPIRVAFVCHGNAARSPMARGLLQALDPELVVMSGGTEPGRTVAPEAVEVMAERGIDISHHRPRKIPPEQLDDYDYVVTFGCERADVVGPNFKGELITWELPNPKGKPLEFFRRVRDEIEGRVQDLRAAIRRGGKPSPNPGRYSLEVNGGGSQWK